MLWYHSSLSNTPLKPDTLTCCTALFGSLFWAVNHCKLSRESRHITAHFVAQVVAQVVAQAVAQEVTAVVRYSGCCSHRV